MWRIIFHVNLYNGNDISVVQVEHKVLKWFENLIETSSFRH